MSTNEPKDNILPVSLGEGISRTFVRRLHEIPFAEIHMFGTGFEARRCLFHLSANVDSSLATCSADVLD